jgi:hypothetical protein
VPLANSMMRAQLHVRLVWDLVSAVQRKILVNHVRADIIILQTDKPVSLSVSRSSPETQQVCSASDKEIVNQVVDFVLMIMCACLV